MSAYGNSNYCLTCLSSTRKLYPIADGKFFACLTLLKLSDASKFTLCWECNSFVKRAMQFRKKALEAYAIMADMGKKMPSHIELSTLSSRNLNHCLSITTHTAVLNPVKLYPVSQEIQKELHVKEELTSFEEQHDPLGMITEDANVESELDVDDEDPLVKTEVGDHDDDDEEPSNGIGTETPPIKTTSIAPKPLPVIKLIRLPPGPVPKNLKPVPVPPKIIKCVTKSLKPKQKKADLEFDPVENVPIQYLPKNIPKEYFPESTGQKNVKVRGKYVIKMMTEESLTALRNKRYKEARENRFRFFCYKCMEFFKTKTMLDEHMDEHVKSTGDFECQVCEMKLETEDLLTIHTNAHFRIIICTVCSEEFSTYDKFVYHYRWNHDETPIECKRCNLTFTNRKLWRNHARAHHIRAACPLCRKLVRSDVMKAHIRAHAPQPILTCEECGKRVRGRMRLYYHNKKEHPHRVGLKEGEAYCPECNLQFKNKFSYQMHLKQSSKHVQEKLRCPECSKEFSCATYLRAHRERLHAARGYNCEQCQLSCTSSRALSRHIMKVHEKKEPLKDKMCDICGRSFATTAILRQHRNGHLNIRPYKCKECNDTFSYSGAMYTHIKLKHRKEKRGKKT